MNDRINHQILYHLNILVIKFLAFYDKESGIEPELIDYLTDFSLSLAFSSSYLWAPKNYLIISSSDVLLPPIFIIFEYLSLSAIIASTLFSQPILQEDFSLFIKISKYVIVSTLSGCKAYLLSYSKTLLQATTSSITFP